MEAASRRDRLTGEAVKWYDRAVWLQGKVLQVPASQRTAYQQDLDDLWGAIGSFEKGDAAAVDTARIQRLYDSFFKRWPSELGEESPLDLR
jgi:hypothetical protein